MVLNFCVENYFQLLFCSTCCIFFGANSIFVHPVFCPESHAAKTLKKAEFFPLVRVIK